MLSEEVYISELCATYLYKITQTSKLFDELGACTVYGIRVCKKDCPESTEYECCEIEDVSSDLTFVENLLKVIAHNMVRPVHIKDVVLDALA